MGRSKAPSLPIKVLSFCRPTELRAERWYAVPKGDETAGLGGFLGLTGPMGRRVLKFDGPSGRGLRWRLRRRLCRRVASLRSGGDSGFAAEGCGLPLCGNAYKVSVTGLAFCVIWHDRYSADWLTAFAIPYPAVPDFSTGKRVTRFSGRFASLRIVFPCHPYAGGRIKHRETIFS